MSTLIAKVPNSGVILYKIVIIEGRIILKPEFVHHRSTFDLCEK